MNRRLFWLSSLSLFVLAIGLPDLSAAAETRGGKTVAIVVTDEGLVPAQIALKRGERVKLVFTRKSASTCITEIVMKEFGVDQSLPLDRPVAVELTPAKAGHYNLKCGMGMETGSLEVK